MLIGIEWRGVPDASGYEVSSSGDVRKRINATHPERRQSMLRRQSIDKDGYRYLRIGGRKWLVHRLVYVAFIGPLEPGLVVCHRDGSRDNNCAENLQQATQRENISHKVAHGTHQVGEKHGRATITTERAKALKDALAASPRSATGRLKRGIRTLLAERFGISRHVIADIECGKTWRHAQ